MTRRHIVTGLAGVLFALFLGNPFPPFPIRCTPFLPTEPCSTPTPYPHLSLNPEGFRHLPQIAMVAKCFELEPNYWMMIKGWVSVESVDPATKKVLLRIISRDYRVDYDLIATHCYWLDDFIRGSNWDPTRGPFRERNVIYINCLPEY
jgi:hypothetical protein